MMNTEYEALSKNKIAMQNEILAERMPQMIGPVIELDHTYADIFNGIDSSIMLFDGRHLNVQYKTRPTREDGYDDVYIPAKRIYGADREKIGLKYTYKSGYSIWFTLDLKDSDLFLFTAANDCTSLFNVADMHRAFFRKREFTSEDFALIKKEADKADTAYVDPSVYFLYIPRVNLIQLMLKDWLEATLGTGAAEYMHDNIETMQDLLA